MTAPYAERIRLRFGEVSYSLEPQIVRVDDDDALERFLCGKLKAAGILSDEILKQYAGYFGKDLNISRNSLALEIFIHWRVQVWARRYRRIVKKSRLAERALRSTKVIDCGERSRDGNRIVWDILSVVMKK